MQKGQGVNSLGELEIPPIVIEELLVNALIHRDNFISAPIRLFIFDNRIELINPGQLPNHLTTAQILNLMAVQPSLRAKQLINQYFGSNGSHLLPYYSARHYFFENGDSDC